MANYPTSASRKAARASTTDLDITHLDHCTETFALVPDSLYKGYADAILADALMLAGREEWNLVSGLLIRARYWLELAQLEAQA